MNLTRLLAGLAVFVLRAVFRLEAVIRPTIVGTKLYFVTAFWLKLLYA